MSKVSVKPARNLAWQRAHRKDAAAAKKKTRVKVKRETAAQYKARRLWEEQQSQAEVERTLNGEDRVSYLRQELAAKEQHEMLERLLQRAGFRQIGRSDWMAEFDEVSESREQELQRKRLEQYDRAAAKARALFREKNAEYKDAISANGVLGAVVEMAGIAQRMHQVLVHPAVTCVEDLEGAEARLLPRAKRNAIVTDKSLDAINFGIISLMMMEEGNWTGN